MAHVNSQLFPYTRKLAGFLREEARSFFWNIGAAVQYTTGVIRFLFQGNVKLKHCLEQGAFVGVDTLGIALVLTTVSGMVIALQLATEMVRQGAGDFVGALVAMALLRELAPIMTGFAVISMAGSAYAAELSTMKITSQVDALRVLHIHPVRYLLVPRILAGTLALPLMTVITTFAGIMGGLLVSITLTDLSALKYLDSVWQQTAPKDVFACLLKAGVFGYLITIIATSVGINTQGGAKEVGIATTRAVVWSFVAMAIVDYLLTYIIYGSQ